MTDLSKIPDRVNTEPIDTPVAQEQTEKAKRMIASYAMRDPISAIDMSGYEVVPHQAFSKVRVKEGSESHG